MIAASSSKSIFLRGASRKMFMREAEMQREAYLVRKEAARARQLEEQLAQLDRIKSEIDETKCRAAHMKNYAKRGYFEILRHGACVSPPIPFSMERQEKRPGDNDDDPESRFATKYVPSTLEKESEKRNPPLHCHLPRQCLRHIS